MTSIKRQKRLKLKSIFRKKHAAGMDHIGYQINRSEQMRKRYHSLKSEEGQKGIIINLMTNWQRNQALKSCKGNVRKMTIDELLLFSNMKHWKGRSA